MHRRLVILSIATALAALISTGQPGAGSVKLSGPGLILEWNIQNDRLALTQMQREDGKPLLWVDPAGRQAGPGPVGNPIAIVMRRGAQESVHGIREFKIISETHTEPKLLAYLQHDTLPLFLVLQVEVDGNVATWQGQVLWNGAAAMEADIFYPILSRVRFDTPQTDRAVTARTSGIELKPRGNVNYSSSYTGNLAAPVFLAEGGGCGPAFVDDNRADYAPDPAAAAQRGQAANTFPPPARKGTTGGEQGPFLGIRHTRAFRPISVAGGEAEYDSAEPAAGRNNPLPIRKLGDAVDLGPVKMYAYTGSWKNGAAWARS